MTNLIFLVTRKEQKKYGTGNLIEGEYSPNKTKCLIIEDVVTTGSSIIETSEALRDHGILVDEAVVILNRNYPAADANLAKNGLSLTSIIKVDQILQCLFDSKRITAAQKMEVETFLAAGQVIPPPPAPAPFNQDGMRQKNGKDDRHDKLKDAAGDVATSSRFLNAHAKKLFEVITSKQSNLCLSADCETWQDVLKLTEAVASKICAVKTHVDALNFQDNHEIKTFQEKLRDLAKLHNFIIIEDRKFGDIGATVEKQLTAKPFLINRWAQFVTVHSIPGPAVLQVFKKYDIGVILIAEMSSAGNLPSQLPEYRNETLKICQGFEDTVVGFVSQTRVGASLKTAKKVGPPSEKNYAYLQFTPGVSLDSTGDSLGQQYVSVRDAILKRDADVVIVGRGIIKKGEEQWAHAAEEYRQQAWASLQLKM